MSADAKGSLDVSSAYAPVSHFVWRASLLPFEYFDFISNGRQRGHMERTDQWDFFSDPAFLNAVTVASPSLGHALTTPGRRNPSVRSKAMQYAIRMCTRPTPYGLFSRTGIGLWANETRAKLTMKSIASAQLDFGWLQDLLVATATHQSASEEICIRTNPLIEEYGGRFHLRRALGPNELKQSTLVSVNSSPLTRYILSTAMHPIARNVLVGRVMREFEQKRPNALQIAATVQQLIDREFLLFDLNVRTDAEDRGQQLEELLSKVIPDHTLTAALRSANRAIRSSLSRQSEWETAPLAEVLRSLGTKSQVSANPPLQVDLFDPNQIQLPDAVGECAAEAATLLLKLSPLQDGIPYLTEYRRRFVAKYGYARFVPLLEVFDPFVGLGAPDFSFTSSTVPVGMETRRDLLIRTAGTSCQDVSRSFELTDTILSTLCLRNDDASYPESLDLFAFVLAQSSDEIATGDFRLMVGPNIGYVGAGRTVGRFALGLNRVGIRFPALNQNGPDDSTDGVINAELTFAPHETRLRNLMQRPISAEYEISIGSTPVLADDKQIDLSDLLIGTHHGKFVVASRAHQKFVKILTTHGLNSASAPPIVRFLSEVSLDGVIQLHAFDWGPASALPFLPRVKRGKIILRPAEWKLSEEEFAQKSATSEDFSRTVEKFRERWQLPQLAYLADGDNRLLLNLSDPDHLELLREAGRRILKKNTFLTLQECLPAIDEVWLKSPDGTFSTEIVVSLVSKVPTRSKPTSSANALQPAPFSRFGNEIPPLQDTSGLVRFLPPGKQCLYCKIYVDQRSEDLFLSRHLAPFLKVVATEMPALQAHFIRYEDPNPHIRLRFLAQTTVCWEDVFSLVNSWATQLMETNVCNSYSFDTYEREIERYGGASAIESCEALFSIDSDVVLSILQEHETRLSHDEKVVGAIVSADAYLAALGYDFEDRLEFCSVYAAHTSLSRYAARQATGLLASYLNAEAEVDQLISRRFPKSIEAYARANPYVSNLRRLQDNGNIVGSIDSIVRSLIHMHMNRVFGCDLKQEQLAMELWCRALRARYARNRRKMSK